MHVLRPECCRRDGICPEETGRQDARADGPEDTWSRGRKEDLRRWRKMDNAQNMKKIWTAIDNIKTVIKGKDESLEKCMCVLLAGGHILMEDIPGVGKTTLALAFSRALSLKQKRMQFTPDVLPSDVTGYHVLQKETGKYVYYPGAVMCNLFLADEINRTSPKTQSALLEVMEERQVTVEGITRKLPAPFLVIATGNPYGAVGTELLPEAEIDRFLISMTLGYPSLEDEIQMAMKEDRTHAIEKLQPVFSREEFLEMQQAVESVYIADSIYPYLTELVRKTRENTKVLRGASPRATIALVRMARASAYADGINGGSVLGEKKQK